MIIICKHCKRNVKSRYSKRKYCSRKCAGASYKIRYKGRRKGRWVKIRCKYCNKIFEIPIHDINNRKFCSNKCRYKFPKSEVMRLKLSKRFLGKTYEEIYGKEKSDLIKKKKTKALLGKKNPMYGRKQREETKRKIGKSLLGNIPWNKGLPRENQPLYKVSPVNKKDLDEELIEKLYLKDKLILSEIAKIMGCSGFVIGRRIKLRGIKLREAKFKRGKEHPNWKGATKEDKLRVNWSSWRKIRYLILKRDIYCMSCGKRDGKLDVHHIDSNWRNNDLNNLILLCASCHKKVECDSIALPNMIKY